MGLDMTKVQGFLVTEWQVLLRSDTVKGLLAIESAAVALFVQQVLAGEVQFTVASLKGWLAAQAAIAVVFLLRKAFAGIEVQIASAKVPVPPGMVRAIEKAVEDRSVKALKDAGHAEAASHLEAELAKPPNPVLVPGVNEPLGAKAGPVVEPAGVKDDDTTSTTPIPKRVV